MRNYFNYFTEIEEHFGRLRARNLLVAPLDWCLIELWKNSGIPLHVAFRGIDRSFEAASKKRSKPPRTLFYCHPAVVEAFEEYQQAVTGQSEEPAGEENEEFSAQKVSDHLMHLATRLEPFEGETFERVRDRLKTLDQELRALGEIRWEELDRTLTQLAELVSAALLEQLPADTAKQIRKEVRSETRIYKKRLSKEMHEKLERNYLHRRLREDMQIPEFSLFQIEE